ncbi:Transcriptional regulator ManR [Bacillus sp. T2.9-1]|uniref:BglG family transcription antiterminator n=1 Tax=Bacillus sp. T2.9-1 TaxID=3041163 RepID=UPI0024774EFB|nr:BglG family transcription antiterminator [Bacillus sp. T2.9-1]CAI9389628.1 Transcriptional regulator ManR [Bacillus sp. T2.9-1]
MNDRQKVLLQLLLSNEGETRNIQELSERLECSEKTVRNDLNKMEQLLNKFPSAKLKRQPGIGITLEISREDRSNLLQRQFFQDHKAMEGRMIEVAYLLLSSENPITLQSLADRYYVPKSTIKKEMEFIEKWLADYEIELISKPRLGNQLQGTELQRRNALAHLPQLISSVTIEKNYVLDLFLPYEISTVKRALQRLQERFEIKFMDETFDSLVIHALIMVKRTRQKSPITIIEEEKAYVASYKEFEYASLFFEQLEESFSMKFPENERIYFTWHLISGKRVDDGEKHVYFQNKVLLSIIHDITKRLAELTAYPFEKDSILTKGLAVHMYSVINRLKYGFLISNPLLSDIKKMYPYMFNMVIFALEEVKSAYDLDVPEEEAAFLVLHFQASIERLEGSRGKKQNSLIVCHLGVGISHLLEAKIKQHYSDIHILDCIGKASIDEFLKNNKIDFVISTVSLDKISIPYIVISPLLEGKDKEKLNQFVQRMEKRKENNSEDSKQLFKLIRGDMVHLGLEIEHPYEVIEMLGNTLYQKGMIQKEFIHSALNRERKSATAIGGNISIPHGDPDMVIQSSIAVGILRKPILWESDYVSVIFLLAISKEDQNLNRAVVEQIAAYSENLEFASGIAELADIKGVLDFIK